jgi:hypothetical protein
MFSDIALYAKDSDLSFMAEMTLYQFLCRRPSPFAGLHISVVVYEVLIKIVILKLSVLNQHRFIIRYSDRLPAMFALILVSISYSLLAKQNECM